MKKLSVSLGLLIVMFATPAIAADSGKEAREGKKKRPSFEDCDKKNTGALTLEEFLACHPRGGEKLFTAMDANKDGKVTREEWQAFKETRRTEKIRQLFDQCDKNKDGALSFEEFDQCMREHKGKRGDKKEKKEAGA
jgi:Ca2+-binding EF-hand superfamily protein